MLDKNDFEKKQIIILFCNKGEKLSFRNDNLIVKDKNNEIKLQATCYKIFSLFVIGHTSITTGLIQQAQKFNFTIFFFIPSFKLYDIIANKNMGNTLLRKSQYLYNEIDIPKLLIKNKINNQLKNLKDVRYKSDYVNECINLLTGYIEKLQNTKSISEIMGYEGLSSKVYFKAYFNNVLWNGRKPRTKYDMINSLLDIGYTVLFNFIEALLNIYGFDLYVGVLHKEFYMRKSLVCDIVEPFRPIIDRQIKKSINLNQFKKDDFLIQDFRYNLKWEKSAEYISIFLKSIMNYKINIFLYIQKYYRSFARNSNIEKYPYFEM